MSLILTDKIPKSKNLFPSAKIKGTPMLLYIEPEKQAVIKDDLKNECPKCGKLFACPASTRYHMKNNCKYIANVEDANKSKYYKMAGNGGEFSLIPTLQREVILITGPPNCGKTYIMNDYVKKAVALYPSRRVILFTSVEQDDTLSHDIDNYIKIMVTDELLETPFEMSEFDNAITIFDDIETSKYPKACKYVYELMGELCRNGRHNGKYGTTVIFTNQMAQMGNKTKTILQNANKYIIFPSVCNIYQLTKQLQNYAGLSKNDIDYLRNRGCRWACINLSVPRHVINNCEAYILDKYVYP